MTFLKKTCIGVLILSVISLYFPNITLAASHDLAQGATITKHAPEMLATPEEKIPVEAIPRKKSRTWLWVLGGAVLVGIIAAVAAGGGGPDPPPPDEKGNVTVAW